MFRIVGLIAIVLGLTMISLAQAPTSAPATNPSVDASTPTGAYILFMRAMMSGDATAARDLLQTNNDDESRLADVLAQTVDQNQKFREALRKQFSDATADAFTGSPADAARAEMAISKAKVNIDKNEAQLAMEGDPQPVKLVQNDGKWKISVAGMAEGEPAQVRDGIAMRLKVLSEVTSELSQGKYKKEIEVQDALRSKLEGALMTAAQASTQPATRAAP